jgi:hypothetical protein
VPPGTYLRMYLICMNIINEHGVDGWMRYIRCSWIWYMITNVQVLISSIIDELEIVHCKEVYTPNSNTQELAKFIGKT